MNYFDLMDKDRYEREKKVFKNFKEPQIGDSKFYNYRLITEEEVPDWIKSLVNKQRKLNRINKFISPKVKKIIRNMAEEIESENK